MADIKQDYYIICIDDDGDVMALQAALVKRKGLMMTVETLDETEPTVAFDNQGDSWHEKWESVSNAMSQIMPDDEEDDEVLDAMNNHGQDG